MKFNFNHCNINVVDLTRSITFYKEALGLTEAIRKEASDGSFVLVYLSDEATSFRLELTWLKDRNEAYELGDNESHIAFKVDDFDGAYELHKKMGCICFENKKMGIYFIEDPDGYWLEVVPTRK